MNPILSVPFGGSRTGEREAGVSINVKASREVSERLALGIEHYSDLGSTDSLTFGSLSGQTTFLVTDYEAERWGLNFGVGRGWTDAVDTWVVKAILGFAF